MENIRLVYLNPHVWTIEDTTLSSVINSTLEHMAWLKDNLELLKKNGVDYDVYTVQNFVLAFNEEKISDEGLVLYGTEEEIYHILNP